MSRYIVLKIMYLDLPKQPTIWNGGSSYHQATVLGDLPKQEQVGCFS